MRASQLIAAGVFLATLQAAGTAAPSKPPSPAPAQTHSPWWPVAHVKARTIAISPDAAGAWRLLPDQLPAGVLSPDGSGVAFLGSPNDDGFALFIADITDETPHRKKNIRQITPVMPSMVQTRWMPDGGHIVFGTFDSADTAIYIVDPRIGAPDAEPRRLSADNERARDPRPGPDGRIAYRTITEMRKPYPGDLVVIGADGNDRRVLADNTDVSSLEWSPDGRHIAYSTAGSLVIVDVADGSKRELPYHEIDDRLYAHYAPAIAWRPDGALIALRLDFAGGTMVDPDAPPAPPPFWDGKLFLLPVGDGELDPAAATWIEAPANVFEITWIRGEEAQRLGTPMEKPMEKRE